MSSIKYIIGIDEAGRGPLAGPVAVGVVMASKHFDMQLLRGVRDSKKLSEGQREAWFAKLKVWKKSGHINFAVALVGPQIIDEKGISFAIRRGLASCLRRLEADCQNCSVLLDGSLKAPKQFVHQKTIIGGDDKEPLISIASIAAKVTRDRKMKKLARQFPVYSFEIHKGYGTTMHRKALKKWGISEIHRRSFLTGFLS
jgi:ribonuclease HII